MNFISTFDELDKLYEDVTSEEAGVEAISEGLTLTDEVKKAIEKIVGLYIEKIDYQQDGSDVLCLAHLRGDLPNKEQGHKEIIAALEKSGFTVVEDEYQNVFNKFHTSFFAVTKDGTNESLKEAVVEDAISEDEVEVPVEEIPAEEPAVEEPRQIICSCVKCGALALKAEADLVVDEESGLANVEEACEYCEETEGFEIVGVVAPYEVVEVAAEEGEELPEEDEAPIEEGVNGPRAAAVDPDSIDPNQMCSVVLVDGGEQVYTGTYNECAKWLGSGGSRKFGGPKKLMIKGDALINMKEHYRVRFTEAVEASELKAELEALLSKYSTASPIQFYTTADRDYLANEEIQVRVVRPYDDAWATHQEILKLLKSSGFKVVDEFFDCVERHWKDGCTLAENARLTYVITK